jgi:o-succinylbenzoate---CoA ligase
MELIWCTEDADIKAGVLSFLAEWHSPKNYVEIKTSGSTGQPKWIKIEKESMRISARKTIDYLKLSPNDKALLCLSVHTIAGAMMIVRAIVGQLKLVITHPQSNPFLSVNENISFAALVPLQIDEILKWHDDTFQLPAKTIVGGAPISPSLQKRLEARKWTVFQTFGMTETISHIAMRKIGFNSDEAYSTLPGIKVSSNAQNQLEIECPEFFSEKLSTTDEVEILDENQFIWKGRTDFVINSGGVKIHPEIVETKLSAVIPIPFMIGALPHTVLGQQVVLVLEGKPIKKWEKADFQFLEKFEIPKLFLFVSNFIRTESGKINRLLTLQKLEDNEWEKVL